jgi:NADPH-dependent curcumin reductase CurA
VNRRVTLASRPTGMPTEANFAVEDAPDPEPRPGEVLVRNRFLSVDPYQRGRMSEARSYAPSLQIGDVITSQSVGEVAASHDPRFSEGEWVVGQTGWQELAAARAGTLRKIDPKLAPPTTALHVLGGTGLTAYFGLFDVGKPVPGDTVAVSAAAGAVGQIVGQLAKISGCRAVGIAGGEEKKRSLLEEFGYDAAVDYKNEDVATALKEACPRGVDVYFDNVGGEVSDAVHRRLANYARIVVCGQISQYNNAQPQLGPRLTNLLVVHRARMEGFLITDYAHRFGEALPRLAEWLQDGKLRYREDVVQGIENAPRAFIGMLNGENRGKTIVAV